jgi:chromosomal replication initiation ATPase DnaA
MSTADDLAPALRAALSNPCHRPVAIRGRTRAGKTTLLRRVASECRVEPIFRSAFDLAGEMADAIRSDRFDRYRSGLTGDERPLVVEHLEDLRGKPSTREELRHILQSRRDQGHATLLTVTNGRGDAEVVEWLEGWSDVLLLG